MRTSLPDDGKEEFITISLLLESKLQSVCKIESTLTAIVDSIGMELSKNRFWEILLDANCCNDKGEVQSEQMLKNVPPVIWLASQYPEPNSAVCGFPHPLG